MTIPARVELGARARAGATVVEYDVSAALPAGVTFERTSKAWLVEGASVVEYAAGVPRFGRTQLRDDLPIGIVLEPAATKMARNDNWATAVAASDPNAFNTAGTTGGAWGTLPSQTFLVRPALTGGATCAWQVAAVGTYPDGSGWMDVRFKIHNPLPVVAGSPTANKLFFRYLWSLFAGVPAAAGQSWSMGADLAIVAGVLPPDSNVQLNIRPTASGSAREVTTIAANVTGELKRFEGSATLPIDPTIDGLSCGIAVSCAPQQDLDITIRMGRPQFEQSILPTTYIRANNAGYITRAAERLTIARAGDWYVRLKSHWRNFDFRVSATDGALKIGLPDEARLLGITTFQKIVLSSEPFPPDEKRLRYHRPPPAAKTMTYVVSPTMAAIPSANAVNPQTGQIWGEDACFPADTDIIVVVPETHRIPLKIVGGRNVYVLGAHIAPRDAPPDWTRTRSTLAFVGVAGVCWVEGCLIDAGGPIQRDGINVDGFNPVTGIQYAPALYRLKTIITGVHGESDDKITKPDGTIGNHSDVTQAFGQLGGMFTDLCEFDTDYQGDFMVFNTTRFCGPVETARAQISYKAFAGDAGIPKLARPNMVWVNRTTPWPAGTPYPKVTFRDTWANVRPDNNFLTNGVFPSTVQGGTVVPASYLVTAGEGGITLAYTDPIQNIEGCVRMGPRPAGPFLTAIDCGLLYKSPGYGREP